MSVDLRPVTTLEAARLYVQRGWRVVPIPKGQKGPQTRGWQNLRIDAGELERFFDNGGNVGILDGHASSNLIDVDLDAPEAVRLAATFLTPTACIHGRAGKPRSHWWFTVPEDIATEQYRDVDGAMLVELRGTGGQTLAPPSLHPSGERVRWDEFGEPPLVEIPILRGQIRQLAAATILARHWPDQGGRHTCALALAGMLTRRTIWIDEDVVGFIAAVAHAAGDNETADRVKTVAYTRRRLQQQSTAIGIPRLAEMVGREVIDRVIEWLGIDLPAPSALSTATAPLTGGPTWPDPLSDEAFHGVAGDVVRLIAPHTEADPAALLINFLVAAGNCIGRGPHAIAEADRHGLNLFAAIVGESSKGRKGSSWGRIRELFTSIDQVWATTRIQPGGLSSGEGLIWAVRDPIEKVVEEREGNRSTGNFVMEVIDPGVTDKRVLVVEGEFASALKSMAREGNTLSAIVRVAWDGGILQSMTKNSQARATGAHVSILGHITRGELLRYLSDTETGNGFANRFLWFCTRRAQVLPEGGGRVDAETLHARVAHAISQARKVGYVQRDEDARQIWRDVYEELSTGQPGLFGAVTARSEAIVLRLSVLYAALDGELAIRKHHLMAALAVWQYAEASARFIFGDALGDPVADRILSALQGSPDGLTRTDISVLFQKNVTSSSIDRALGVLLSNHRATMERQSDGRGRPSELWRAVN